MFSYQSGEIFSLHDGIKMPIVSDVSFTIKDSKSLAIIGETGSGKTMIALSIMGLLPKNIKTKDFSINFLSQNLTVKESKKLLGDKIVYIPQNGLEFLNPTKKICYHLYDSFSRIKVPKKMWKNLAIEKLTLAGLTDAKTLLNRYPWQLSGGMAQRVTIAIAACSDAKLVIADEPTNGLDCKNKLIFIDLLKLVFPTAKKLIITHDIELASLLDDCLVLLSGKMMEKGTSEEVLKNPKNPYTKALLASLVKNGMHETPVLCEQQGFCPFYCRCNEKNPACLKQITVKKTENSEKSLHEWWCNSS